MDLIPQPFSRISELLRIRYGLLDILETEKGGRAMRADNRKVVLIGTGMVGMSYAYSLLNQNVCDELVLIDIDRKRA